MKNFLILTNEQKDPGFRISKQIQDYIEKNGGKSHRMCEFTRHIQKDMKCITKDTECVIVLGGDGTMLHAARLVVDHDIPMVGVNLGTLGFLTEIELSKLYEGLDGLLNDTFQVEERMMLDGPICPHSLQSNSLVLSQDDEIDIYIENVRESQLEEAYVTFDGQVARKLQPGDVLQVRRSKKIARIIKVKGDSFYRILRIKVGGQNEEE